MSIYPSSVDSQSNNCVTLTPTNVPLKFVQVNLGPDPDNMVFRTPALLDSGASATVIDISLLKSHSALHKFQFTAVGSNCKLSLAQKGSWLQILGHLQAYLLFQDQNGCSIPFYCNIIVASGLKHALYLGANLIFSRQWLFTTEVGILFRPGISVLGIESMLCGEGHFVPFMTQKSADKYLSCEGVCRTMSSLFISPQQCSLVRASVLPHPGRSIAQDILVTLDQSHLDSEAELSILPMIYPVIDGQVNLIISNKGLEPFCLAENTDVGLIENYVESNFSNLQIKADCNWDETLNNMSFSNISVHNMGNFELNLLHNTDSDDVDIQKQLNEKGIAMFPISDVYDKLDAKRTISKEVSDEIVQDVGGLLALDHLTQQQQELVCRLVNYHRPAFATSIKELQPCKLVTLDAKITEQDLSKYICQYRDIPLAHKDEVNAILTDMALANIIGPATGRVLLISNLMTRKKKSGALRLILDNRLSNAVTMKLNDIGSPPLLSLLTDMRDATLVSNADLTSSFYQIPVTRHLSDLLCFRGPDRMLWQLKRCPMGYINSSAALSACITRMKNLPVLSDELSGILGPLTLPAKPTSPDDVKLCTSRIPRQVIGRLDAPSSESLAGQPRFSDLPEKTIRKSHMVLYPARSGIASYCDDLVIHTSHSEVGDRNKHHRDLPIDYDAGHGPPHSSVGSTAEPSFSLPSGRRVFTGRCVACEKNEASPSDADLLLHLQMFELFLVKLK